MTEHVLIANLLLAGMDRSVMLARVLLYRMGSMGVRTQVVAPIVKMMVAVFLMVIILGQFVRPVNLVS